MSALRAARQPIATTAAAAWRNPRVIAFAGGAALTVLAAVGFTERALFDQPDTLKYVVTVIGPALIAGLALSRRPLRILVGLAILVAPVNARASLGGANVTPLLAVLLLAVPLAAVTGPRARASSLAVVTPAVALALLPAIVTGASPLTFAAWLAETAAVGWVVYIVAREPGGTRFVLGALIVSMFAQGALAVYESRTGHLLNLYSSSGVASAGQNYFFNYGALTRASGTLSDPIALGNVLALAIPLFAVFAINARSWSTRSAIMFAACVTGLGLVATLSRMSWIAAGSGLLACLVLLPGRARIRTAGAAVGAIAIVAAIAFSFGGADLGRRLDSILNPTNTHSSYQGTALGDRTRVSLWTASLQLARSDPLGTGFGSLEPALERRGVSVADTAPAQNWYFEILGEAGLLGAAALLALLGAAARDLRRAFDHDRVFVAGAAGALVAVLVTWTTDSSPRYLQVSATIAALLGCIAARATRLGPRAPALVAAEAGHRRPALVLATPSPAVEAVLRDLGVPFRVPLGPCRAPATENVHGDPTPVASQLRRRALRQALDGARPGTNEVVLGAASAMHADGRLFDVPEDEQEARAMLRSLRGGTHEIIGAVALIWGDGLLAATAATTVTLRRVSEEEIDSYLASDAWRGRPAGIAYGPDGAEVIEAIDGDFDNLLGLPTSALLEIYPQLLDDAAAA